MIRRVQNPAGNTERPHAFSRGGSATAIALSAKELLITLAGTGTRSSEVQAPQAAADSPDLRSEIPWNLRLLLLSLGEEVSAGSMQGGRGCAQASPSLMGMSETAIHCSQKFRRDFGLGDEFPADRIQFSYVCIIPLRNPAAGVYGPAGDAGTRIIIVISIIVIITDVRRMNANRLEYLG